jgi:uncharacterized protein YndB with AHSA1/START domain
MTRNYTVSTRIRKPVDEVFAAVVSGDQLNRYFTERTSGDLVEGDRISWHWNEWGDYPVVVRTVAPNRLIELVLDAKAWKKTTDESYAVRVIIEFEALDDGATKVSISEAGWKTDADGLMATHDNCGGWTQMALGLKAYLEHGIDLR